MRRRGIACAPVRHSSAEKRAPVCRDATNQLIKNFRGADEIPAG